VFSEVAANKAVKFFERVLVHTQGEWAGRPFTLEPWQRDEIIRPLFGTMNEDGTRQYRTAYVELPRKNGKSEIAAGIALYLLFGDGEEGAQVYGAAADKDQASIVFNVASEMVRRQPVLDRIAKRVDSTKRILKPASGSFYRAIPADAAGSHGFNAHGVIFDELHVQPNRELWDVLTTSTGARRQPLVFAITTAGYDRHSICWELHEYATRILTGVVNDPRFFAYIRGAAPEDNWQDEAVWRKVNPALGAFRSLDEMRDLAKRASETPGLENTFRRLYLNQWTSQDTRWLSLAKWDACRGEMPDLKGRPCYAGIDLSSTTDVSALALLFPLDGGEYAVKTWFWLPADNIEQRVRRDRVPYDVWARQGFIETTPGNVVDYAYIRERVGRLAEDYNIREAAYDPWNATQLILNLQEDGLTMVPIRQGFASLAAPTKALETLVLGQKIRHDGNPVLRWMVDNVQVATDPAGNIKPDKGRSRERIDGVAAMIDAIDRASRNESRDSAYAERGVLVW
jgi:phage terminase large subunit-like protein